jgi:hypothetical protein
MFQLFKESYSIYVCVCVFYFYAFIFEYLTSTISIMNVSNKTENWTLRDYCSCKVLSLNFSYTAL